jgi:signal transduction histidine kinase
MLGYSRESEESRESPVDVCALVEQTALLLSKEFLNGITLQLRLDRSAAPVWISAGKLQQALLNLVVNAAEALNGAGTLSLAVQSVTEESDLLEARVVTRPRPAGSYVKITIADSGPGIALEIIDRVFEPFFTTKLAGTKKGTGLGLSLVHMVATQEGLGLAVRSQPAKGTVFFLFLPVGNDKAVPAGPAPPDQSDSRI